MNPTTISRRRQHRRKRGAVIIVLLAVFAVTAALAAVWARRIVFERRHLRRAEEKQQAKWLAEAGVRRAAARLAVDPQYDGEDWLIAADQLGRDHPAVVALRVQAADGDPRQVLLTANARYPAEESRVRATKTVTYALPDEEPSS